MHDVGTGLFEEGQERAQRGEVGRVGVTPDRRHGHAERGAAGNPRDRRAHPRFVAAGIVEQAHLVAARRLFGGQIDHMTKQAAKRRAKHMHDPQRVCIQDAYSDNAATGEPAASKAVLRRAS